MTNYSVVVEPVDHGRFAVMLLDLATPAIKGPDGGDENRGYTADELRPRLRDHYHLSESEIASCIASADQARGKP